MNTDRKKCRARIKHCFIAILLIGGLASCGSQIEKDKKKNLERAEQTLDCLLAYYSIEGTNLFRETYPSKMNNQAAGKQNEYSYLWPYSGTFSAILALYQSTGNTRYKALLEDRILPGMEAYFDTIRTPHAYSSYINSAKVSDRYYDDNLWIGINFIDLYQLTKEEKLLEKVKLIWQFIESGKDDLLDGGIYWREQRKLTKNTCSNAPAAVLALKLFMASADSTYLEQGKELYEWTKLHLQDEADYLYFDNISLTGYVRETKHSYNSGQMLQAASLLYKLTKEERYLQDAHKIASSCHNYFFSDYNNGKDDFRLLRNGDNWFIAVMTRGFLELYDIDRNAEYLIDINKSLDYAWTEARGENGLFEDRKFGGQKSANPTKWLLTQAGMVELYARLSAVK